MTVVDFKPIAERVQALADGFGAESVASRVAIATAARQLAKRYRTTVLSILDDPTTARLTQEQASASRETDYDRRHGALLPLWPSKGLEQCTGKNPDGERYLIDGRAHKDNAVCLHSTGGSATELQLTTVVGFPPATLVAPAVMAADEPELTEAVLRLVGRPRYERRHYEVQGHFVKQAHGEFYFVIESLTRKNDLAVG